ncbi:helix-turn-helix transcriptional regulator [Pseudonocardia sp. TRM90224]|uniref:helix-turn-helix transcriptional regulator n=1 Tax=Pseudonocardia sp. TRM90224 TaxID=2812678 RepID=UPI001E4EFBE8|nr:LuxR C-terminal-related transcriptional regulator [Pseudonocardia sp. TRM90224]
MSTIGKARTLWRAAELTSLVGRDTLLRDAERLLCTTRLLTLVGPGGVGKTRLAIEVARRSPHDLSVAYLADVDTPVGLHREVIRAAGIIDQSSKPTIDVLVEHLKDRRQLLVLDNCEHLWDDVGELIDVLLPEAPGLHILATSRRSLDLVGEHVLRVEPLRVHADGPEPGAGPTEAMILLLDRTAATGRPVDVGDPHVQQLVEWSGGLPLVLELIAVRIGGGLAPSAILDRLDGGRLLTATAGPRLVQAHHHTLQHVLDWSYELCSEGEQTLWARVSVFAGGFTLNAAEEVCSDTDGAIAESDVINLLDGLVRQSLVVANEDGRYQQLQPLREYGRHKLDEHGEEWLARERHCAYFQRAAAEAARQWYSGEELTRMHEAADELPNLRAALNHCVSAPELAQTGLVIATDLVRLRFCFFFSLMGEFGDWIERLLWQAKGDATPARVNAMIMLGWIRLNQGDLGQAAELLEACRRLTMEAANGEHPGMYFLNGAQNLLHDASADSVALLGRSRELFAAAGAEYVGDRAMAGLIQAVAAALCGDEESASTLSREMQIDTEAAGAVWTASWANWATGLVELRFGEPSAATKRFQETLTQQCTMDDEWGTIWSIEAISWSLAAVAEATAAPGSEGLAEWAAEIQGAAERMQDTTGVNIAGLKPLRDLHDSARDQLRAILGETRYDDANRRGATLARPAAYALARRAQEAAVPHFRHITVGALTERQQQIAELVAAGMRNREIAEKLFVSVRTVEHHLSDILTKIGATNRVQLARWVAEQPFGH